VAGIDGQIEIFVCRAVAVVIQFIAGALELGFIMLAVATIPGPSGAVGDATRADTFIDTGDATSGGIDILVDDVVTIVVHAVTELHGPLVDVGARVVTIRAETIPKGPIPVSIIVFTRNTAAATRKAHIVLVGVALMAFGAGLYLATPGAAAAIAKVHASVVTGPAISVNIAGLTLNPPFDHADGQVPAGVMGGSTLPAEGTIRIVTAESRALVGAIWAGHTVAAQALFMGFAGAFGGPHWGRCVLIESKARIRWRGQSHLGILGQDLDIECSGACISGGPAIITSTEDAPQDTYRNGPSTHARSPLPLSRTRVATPTCWGEERSLFD
jgi:hypothetical protein